MLPVVTWILTTRPRRDLLGISPWRGALGKAHFGPPGGSVIERGRGVRGAAHGRIWEVGKQAEKMY